jgi:hypothetical protein
MAGACATPSSSSAATVAGACSILLSEATVWRHLLLLLSVALLLSAARVRRWRNYGGAVS